MQFVSMGPGVAELAQFPHICEYGSGRPVKMSKRLAKCGRSHKERPKKGQAMYLLILFASVTNITAATAVAPATTDRATSIKNQRLGTSTLKVRSI
jgi:hypothetical protein